MTDLSTGNHRIVPEHKRLVCPAGLRCHIGCCQDFRHSGTSCISFWYCKIQYCILRCPAVCHCCICPWLTSGYGSHSDRSRISCRTSGTRRTSSSCRTCGSCWTGYSCWTCGSCRTGYSCWTGYSRRTGSSCRTCGPCWTRRTCSSRCTGSCRSFCQTLK